MEDSHRFWTKIVGLPAPDGVVERLKRVRRNRQRLRLTRRMA